MTKDENCNVHWVHALHLYNNLCLLITQRVLHDYLHNQYLRILHYQFQKKMKMIKKDKC